MNAPDSRTPLLTDDWAYMLPMFAFLGFVWLGGSYPDYYPHTYIARCVCVAILLVLFWRQYTRITWNGWWLGLIVGVIGIFQWIGMQQTLQWLFPSLFAPKMELDAARHLLFFYQHGFINADWMQPEYAAFNPYKHFGDPVQANAFIAFRWIVGASIIVPIMEELFWRDFAWRTIIAPNDFKLAGIGELDWKAFVGVAVIFAVVHGNWWLTSIVWAIMISGLLAYTRSIGACIIAHGTTNFLLGAYVLYTRDWSYW